MEGGAEAGVADGSGTLVRVEGGWGGEGEGGGLVGLEFINARLKLVVVGFYSIVLVLEFSARPSDLKQFLILLGLAGFELYIFSL